MHSAYENKAGITVADRSTTLSITTLRNGVFKNEQGPCSGDGGAEHWNLCADRGRGCPTSRHVIFVGNAGVRRTGAVQRRGGPKSLLSSDNRAHRRFRPQHRWHPGQGTGGLLLFAARQACRQPGRTRI